MWTESRVMRLIFKVTYRMPNSLNIRNHAHLSVLIKNYVIIRLFLHTHLTVWQRGICSHFYFWWYQGLNSGPPPWATPHVLFYDGLFWDRVLRTICPGWLQTTILLISVSWVTRITDVSYQCPASYYDFLKLVIIRSIHSWKNSSDLEIALKIWYLPWNHLYSRCEHREPPQTYICQEQSWFPRSLYTQWVCGLSMFTKTR
jgi:hypothetical protein